MAQRVLRITAAHRLASIGYLLAIALMFGWVWLDTNRFVAAAWVLIVLLVGLAVERYERRRLPSNEELVRQSRYIDTRRFSIEVPENRVGTGLSVARFKRSGRPLPDRGWEPSDKF
jgi:hypothetical protein